MRYKPLPKGDVSAETALIQAMSTLDAASEVAERGNDVEGLLNVAAMWMKMGESLTEFSNSQVMPLDHGSKSNIQTGFQRTEIVVDEETEDD